MDVTNIAAFYSILAAIAMLIYWWALYKNDEHNELLETPIKKIIRLGRDSVTIVLLFIGAIGLFSVQVWGLNVYFVSMGLLLFYLFDFSIYHGRKKDWPPFGFFAVLTIVAIAFTVLMALP